MKPWRLTLEQWRVCMPVLQIRNTDPDSSFPIVDSDPHQRDAGQRRFSETLEAHPEAVEGLYACVADLHPIDEDPDPQ